MAWSGLVTCVALLPVALVSGESLTATHLRGWLVLIALGLFSHALGQSLIAYALAHLPAAFSSVALLLQPAVAALLAWLLLDEAIGPWQAAGRAGHPRRHHPRPLRQRPASREKVSGDGRSSAASSSRTQRRGPGWKALQFLEDRRDPDRR